MALDRCQNCFSGQCLGNGLIENDPILYDKMLSWMVISHFVLLFFSTVTKISTAAGYQALLAPLLWKFEENYYPFKISYSLLNLFFCIPDMAELCHYNSISIISEIMQSSLQGDWCIWPLLRHWSLFLLDQQMLLWLRNFQSLFF